MIPPCIDVDLEKIRHNARTLVGRLGNRGINVTGVTKAVCGDPAIAQAMLDGGCVGLADARLSNVERMRTAGLGCPITLIRTPMLSQVSDVVRCCDASYNTEIGVIAGLAAAALRQNKVHDVILVVEMGDQREGIEPADVAAVARQVVTMHGVALKGIAANFACLSGIAPTPAKMTALCNLSGEVERVCGQQVQVVSGGNSANLPWALGSYAVGRVNDLRLGEAILLGVDPMTGEQIGGMYPDAFALIAEVIEADAAPPPPALALIGPELARLRLVSNSADNRRVILAIGRQDTDIKGLKMPSGLRLIGATSDHLVIGATRATPKVGSEIRFQMNYSALMQAMAAPDVGMTLTDHREPKRSTSCRTAKRLVLI